MPINKTLTTIQDSLIFEFDADNRKCYPDPQTGTTAFNLVNGANNGTLTNGVGYSNGAWDLDGVNDYIITPTVTLGTKYTVSIWFKPDAFGDVLLGHGPVTDYFFWLANSSLVYINRALGPGDFKNWTVPTMVVGNWYNLVATSNDSTTGELFFNGVSRGTRTFVNNNSQTIRFIGAMDSGSSHLNGSISQVLYYNRALTPDEVRQNYEALKYRYE